MKPIPPPDGPMGVLTKTLARCEHCGAMVLLRIVTGHHGRIRVLGSHRKADGDICWAVREETR